MGKPLALSNGAVLRTTTGARLGRTPPPSRTWQLVNSYKGSFGLEYTNFIHSMPNPLQDIRNGSSQVLYTASILEDQGHIARDGTLVSVPQDANIDACWHNARLNVSVAGGAGMKNMPEAYNGRVIVFKVVSGAIGDGNTLGFQNIGSSTTNVVDSTGAGYRVELTIADVANWNGEFIMRINFGGTAGQQSRLDALAALSNVKLAAFFKDQEARFDDRLNNPWKEWDHDHLTYLDHFDILRPMDYMGHHNLAITHIKDFNSQSNSCWGGGRRAYATGSSEGTNSHSRQQGHPIDAFLNLCEHGSPSGNPWTGWINMPIQMCCPVRPVLHTFWFVQGANYLEDGVAQSFAPTDNMWWFDPAWVDLSSLSVISGPTKGAVVSIDTTTGRVIYDPTGGTPHDHVSGEIEEQITFQFNRIDYDANNNPSIGGLDTWIVPLRVLRNNDFGGGYYCRLKGSQFWQLNKTWYQDANRWQSQARALVDAIVASGYSSTRPLYIEPGNETWNQGGVFEMSALTSRGAGSAHQTEWEAWQAANSKNNLGNEEFGGGGVILAYLRNYVEEELANQSLSYNLKWICSTQTGNSSFAASMTQGHLFVLDDIFGYTAQEQADAMAGFYCSGTSYTSNVLNDNNTTDSITGRQDKTPQLDGDGATTSFVVSDVSGTRPEYRSARVNGVAQTEGVDFTITDDGTDITFTFTTAPPAGDENVRLFVYRHSQEVLDRFDGTAPGYAADSSTLLNEMLDWMTGDTIKSINNTWVVNAHNVCKAATEAEGGEWFGDYEGGDHNTNDHIPDTIKDSPRTNSAGKTLSVWYQEDFMITEHRATIVADLYEKRLANNPNDRIAQYGGLFRRQWGGPWEQGLPTVTPRYPDIQHIIDNYGRL